MLELQSERRWGLTGTPKTTAGVKFIERMAILFGIDLMNLSEQETDLHNMVYNRMRAKMADEDQKGKAVGKLNDYQDGDR